ncbi:ArnT family glycosyltransferase [Tautonia marina]|uniref:ArnT family glycosyltransferase n=1 Tax=Tautonia marina TaxID=2653855 RepID=UPI0012612018|nr:glycosyltransferase family 39 protein [Tautonia marina]
MIPRHRSLIAILVLTALLQIVGMIRTPLPSQDGLKFIRIAREFGEQPWADVVRNADQHPLYPALIATLHPAIAPRIANGPDSWRIAAQAVSMLAILAAIPLVFALARRCVGRRSALLATLLFPIIPLFAELGHETLSDATALLFAVAALAFGTQALTTGHSRSAIACGLCAGLGYLARPEVAVVPVVVLAGGFVNRLERMIRASRKHSMERDGTPILPPPHLGLAASLQKIALLVLPFVVLIGSYAAVKGTVSEKLSLRVATGLGDGTGVSRSVPLWVPPGLDDPRWDFAPKEESDAPGRLGLLPASVLVARRATEASVWVLIPLACWGAWHHRGPRRSRPARQALGLLAVGFLVILIRHTMTTGYLSDRHCALFVVAVLPWSAFGLLDLARRWADRRALAPARRQRLARLALALLLVGVVALQLKPGHASRWGYQQAGQWLAQRAGPGDAVLDTRGWAAFVSDLRSYGPWHIRQALTDEKLAYIVISDDELTAESRRAETLAALLDYAAVPVAAFPERQGGDTIGVHVYRFAQPESWEGILR